MPDLDLDLSLPSDGWRQAIAHYDDEVAAGTIAFGPEGFAETVDASPANRIHADRVLAAFVREHVRPGPGEQPPIPPHV